MEESIWDERGIEHKETVKGKKEITTHVSIHTMHLDGLRELHRHFLRLPDGAIVEVSGRSPFLSVTLFYCVTSEQCVANYRRKLKDLL